MQSIKTKSSAYLLLLFLVLPLCGHRAVAQADIPLGGGGMDGLPLTSNAQSRSISPENFSGAKGEGGKATTGTGAAAAANLGKGWKVSPSVDIPPGTTFTLANINGSGCIEHIWMTPSRDWHTSILRVYWDGEAKPSIECPVGDFFAQGTGEYAQINSLAVCVNPGSGFNCYWRMPFRKSARITLENPSNEKVGLYYQIDYALQPLPDNTAYFHAYYHEESPLKEKGLYTILDGIKGKGQYVGTYMVYETHRDGWWGEGEIKFYLDGDNAFPTINGTGTEDYFCGSYNFEHAHKYITFSTPYSGLVQVLPPDKTEKSDQRFSLYRWHIADPIRFDSDLKVTIQDLGWQQGKYFQLNDSISSVAFWYQTP